MPEKRPTWDEIERDRDEPVKLSLDPETALRGLLAVDPESEPLDDELASPSKQSDGRSRDPKNVRL